MQEVKLQDLPVLNEAEKQELMQTYYRENGIDFDDHQDVMEPSECKE